MINIKIPQIIYQLYKLQPISQELLDSQIKEDSFSSPLITLINLVSTINSSKYTLYEIQTYLKSLLSLIELPIEEYKYTFLILLIKATKTDFQYAQEIYDLYTSLITIPNDSTYHTWLNYMLDTNILPYLIYLHIEHDELSDRIINYPAEIVNYV